MAHKTNSRTISIALLDYASTGGCEHDIRTPFHLRIAEFSLSRLRWLTRQQDGLSPIGRNLWSEKQLRRADSSHLRGTEAVILSLFLAKDLRRCFGLDHFSKSEEFDTVKNMSS
jgi:hypothetical protein